MTKLEKYLAAMSTILAFATSMGWITAGKQTEHRQVAINTLADALARCDRTLHAHGIEDEEVRH